MASSLKDPRYRRIIDRLREARLAAGLTQAEVANRIDRPQSFVAKTEGYERRLDALEFSLMANALGISGGELLEGNETSRSPTSS